MDTLEKDYKKDRPYSNYIEILKCLGYSYNTTASLEEKEKISTLFKKAGKYLMTTSPVSLSSHHGFFEENNLPSKYLPIPQAEIRHIPSKKTEKMTTNDTNFSQHTTQQL